MIPQFSPSVLHRSAGRTGKIPSATDARPYPAGIRRDMACDLQTVLAGIRENASARRFMDSIDAANSALGNRAFLQFVGKLHPLRNRREARRIAAAGLRGPGRPLTHLDALQQAFGHHDVSAMREHAGPVTGAALDRLNAQGFTSNGRMAFADTPDLHTQAHEAAHGIQQTALGNSMTLEGGIGKAGDRYERHADEVADAVVAGRDAQPLLDRLAPQPTAVAAGPADDSAPVQMVTGNLRKLLPDLFRFVRLTPATYAVSRNIPYKHDDTDTLMKNYRQGGSTESGFSRPFSVVNRLAIAHVTGEDMAALRTAYDGSWWPDCMYFRPQRPSLQHLGQLLDEGQARIAGGRFLRYMSVNTVGLSEGDRVVIPTFNPAELIQSPKMFGIAFNFLTRRLHFGMPANASEKVIIELAIPDKHKLALPYGDLTDTVLDYTPCLINPWLYVVDEISVVGAAFPDARNATSYDEREHAPVKFIRLRAAGGSDLQKMTKNMPSARNLYTGRNISLKDLLDVYGHLFHHRTSDELPPIDMSHL